MEELKGLILAILIVAAIAGIVVLSLAVGLWITYLFTGQTVPEIGVFIGIGIMVIMYNKLL